jgi:hypothetical protein
MLQPQRLSQGHLKTLQDCPRKFQYIYLDALRSPIAPVQQGKMQWGSDFHRLVHQYALGLPIEPFLEQDPALGHAFRSIQAQVPELFITPQPATHASEALRTLAMGPYIFTAIYDLLVLEDTAQIIDWKTHAHPRQARQLKQDWQTRLYCYLLAATSDYPPEAIEFTYWFVQAQPPRSVTISYDTQQHQHTQADLERRLAQLDRWLSTYPHQPLPMLKEGSAAARQCAYCSFAARCDRLAAASPAGVSLTLDGVEEVAI